MANVSNVNFNGWPIDGSFRSQTQYNLFAAYLAEGFRASASKSIPGDVSIFSFFFSILNLLACLAAGALLLIWIVLSWIFGLLFKSKKYNEEVYEEIKQPVNTDYSPEMLDWLLSDEYAKLCEERENNK
jgi:hypothetical protein